LAAVALTLDAPLLEVPSGPRDIVVPFAGATLIWAYYVVTRYAGDIAALRIVDTTPGNGPRAVTFGDAGRVDLRQAPDLDDAVGAALLRSNPDARVIRFLSNASVPVRETPLRHLELHLGDSRLAGDLANPRLDRFTSLRVAPAPAPPAATLYQVLTLPST
jgi:hypothetical protein